MPRLKRQYCVSGHAAAPSSVSDRLAPNPLRHGERWGKWAYLVPSADRPSDRGVPIPAELQRQAQDSVRRCVTSAASPEGSSRGWVVPIAAGAAVAAAACAPVVWPVLAAGAGGAAAVSAALGQVGALGGGLLAEVVIRAWDRLQSSDEPKAGQANLHEALAAELEAALTRNTSEAAALRSQVAGVLQGVGAVQVALTTTIEESAASVREVLVQGLRELGEEFSEFGWVLEEVNLQLTIIAEDVAHTAAAAREVADNQQQTLMELALLRQEARSAFRHRGAQPGTGTPAEISTDQKRAAALDDTGVHVSGLCPYPGLAAFQPNDAERFFGREQLTADLIARAGELIARPGLLVVLGPSGSGKSSLLKAGFLPAVAAGAFPARGSWSWPRDVMSPGRRPLTELAARVASLARIPAGALEADLRADPGRIIAAVRQALFTHARQYRSPSATDAMTRPASIRVQGADGTSPTVTTLQGAAEPRLILIIDQFEELFTQCTDEGERRTFIKAICAAAGTVSAAATPDAVAHGHADACDAPALVVIGVRADFYARIAAYPELVLHLRDRQVVVGPVNEAGLRAAIEKPAAIAGTAGLPARLGARRSCPRGVGEYRIHHLLEGLPGVDRDGSGCAQAVLQFRQPAACVLASVSGAAPGVVPAWRSQSCEHRGLVDFQQEHLSEAVGQLQFVVCPAAEVQRRRSCRRNQFVQASGIPCPAVPGKPRKVLLFRRLNHVACGVNVPRKQRVVVGVDGCQAPPGKHGGDGRLPGAGIASYLDSAHQGLSPGQL